MGRRAKRVGWGVAEQLFLQEKHGGFHLDRDWKKIEGKGFGPRTGWRSYLCLSRTDVADKV